MPGKAAMLRYFVVLREGVPTHDEIHISYENIAWLIDGYAGYQGPEWGQWAASIRAGPWWDGTKPVIVLMPPTWQELTQYEFL